MTDRELLELAAKACGYTIRENGTDVNGDAWYWCEQVADCWNPLNDNGDALQIAVKLMMSVEISEHEESTYAYAGSAQRVYACEMWLDDKNAATRRAIVRAAAELGKVL